MQITRKYEFDAAHRVQRHGGKCANLHGHRYAVEATVEGDVVADNSLSEYGMVTDFTAIKLALEEVVGRLDHTTILESTDPLCELLGAHLASGPSDGLFEPYACGPNVGMVWKTCSVPTAENFASWFRILLRRRGINVVNVRVYETPNCWADCSI